MKIDETEINHNALRIIKELVETRYDIIEPDKPASERAWLLMTLGEIGGVIDLADALKEELRV